jgi:mono/diheme cytochrome c family protein
MYGFDRLGSCNALLLLPAAIALVASAISVGAAPRKADDFPSGQQLFQDHCATCHGTDGTGNGPMAQVLKIPPADLHENYR